MNKLVYPDYSNCIVNFMSSIRKYYGLNIHHNTLPLMDELLNKDYTNIVVILLDGLGSKIIDKTIGNNSFLKTKKVGDFLSVFPCTTAAATTSYLATLSPIETSWLGWHMYFKNIDKDIVLFLSCGYYDFIKEDYDVANTYIPYLSILDELKTVGVDTKQVMPAFAIDGAKDFDDFLNKIDSFIYANDNKKFVYAYYDEPDHSLHEFGVTGIKTIEKIKYLNDKLEEYSKTIKDNTLVVVVADHGHVDVQEINLYGYPQFLSLLERLPSIEPRCSTFYVKEGMHKEFEDEFNSLWKDDFILLTKDEVLKKQIFGKGNIHPKVNDFIGDYVAIAKGHYMFGYNANLDEECFMKATHAGLLEDEMVIPLIKL